MILRPITKMGVDHFDMLLICTSQSAFEIIDVGDLIQYANLKCIFK